MDSNVTMMMKPWLHFTGGDNLYFETWHPSSSGAIAGACIGLVVLSLFERWLSSTRAVLEGTWKQRALSLVTNPPESDTDENSLKAQPPAVHASRRHLRTIAPFIATHDIPRGAIHAAQVLLGYILMLAIMTFQAAYVISIILGLGIGEMLFGRMGSTRTHVLH